ncbi:MAG TPA: magnesium/cobalt transporter CorA [Methanomassiliicoccales archaeon]|nr:magnesium/cobalt transporter CorA [Methanomassiliicoccales archaeon]HPR98920.1 magnesium/cobalt transporter CorA [Methanomassiliicoccales archaeon]
MSGNRFMKKHHSKKTGMPPGSVIYVGDGSPSPTEVSVIDYTEADVLEKKGITFDECMMMRDNPSITWINFSGLADVEQIKKVGDIFGLHPLVMEDILHMGQRPKLELYDKYVYLVVKMIYRGDNGKEVTYEQLSIVMGKNYVLTFQEREGDVFNSIRERVKGNKGRLRKSGADYLVYSLLDAVVDNYFPALEKIGDLVEDIEERLSDNPEQDVLSDIYRLKREVLFLRKSIWPIREVVAAMMRQDIEIVSPNTNTYLRDVYDHSIQVMDVVETYTDMLSELTDVYMSTVSNRMNEIMKTLTIIATIFIPLTFIVGLYGMNFKYMPELTNELAYPVVLVGMAIVSGIMLVYFRRKGWLG